MINNILPYFKNSRKRVAWGWIFVHVFFLALANFFMQSDYHIYADFFDISNLYFLFFQIVIFPAIFFISFLDSLKFSGFDTTILVLGATLIFFYYFLYGLVVYYANKFNARFYFLNGIFAFLFLLNLSVGFYLVLSNNF